MVTMSGKRSRLVSTLALCAALAAGCGNDRPAAGTDERVDPGSAPAESPSTLVVRRDGGWTARGFVVIRDGRARLCELLRESLPPQCGGRSLALAHVERADLDFERLRGVAWTGPVTLSGRFERGVLTVDR